MPVLGDTVYETRDFSVTLSNASSGATIADGAATGTIRNDDAFTFISGQGGAGRTGWTIDMDLRSAWGGNDTVGGFAGADTLIGGAGVTASRAAGR